MKIKTILIAIFKVIIMVLIAIAFVIITLIGETISPIITLIILVCGGAIFFALYFYNDS
jgi:uncharacterized membrane-anchored protein